MGTVTLSLLTFYTFDELETKIKIKSTGIFIL